MENEICSSHGCQQQVAVLAQPVWNRRPVHQALYCEEHARVFLENYNIAELAGEGPRQYWDNAVAFEIELMLCEYCPNKSCRLFLREVGGSRRFDCAIGVFESAAIRQELNAQRTLRPLTHRAMVNMMTELGGRLERLVVDRFLPEHHLYEAKLHVNQANERLVMDVRVSDGIVLALICGVPIFVSNVVLASLREE